ncbi:ABC transporter ATP-binding protein [Facklamia miroungae]|uniref:Putative ABC transport system ATP-binding protein n=1 Tax=Facklamia miroungae TaxID=120956 RepID=A0A1G7TRU5_9LACT|nr:ATP-binding cassette domain-containing protein [Facklamia miroungae]NKZ29946.1 ATP-binding cassette domain-containing protein [Facklamia miroungae]SDG38025.1 putative ABC transport system ATP-binding protein [Facklamia miroungae]
MSTILEVKNLTIQSPKKKIISDLSFQIKAGDFVSVKGPSGSGKSTLLKELVYLNAPNLSRSGKIYFNDKEISDYPPIELRQNIAYCFQTAQLFGRTVEDNLSFPYEIRDLSVDKEKINYLLDEVRLSNDYYKTEIQNLSGGEKQRIALIRNLIFPPKILLLDEVTSALDQETREILWSWLLKYIEKEDITTLMISHLSKDHQYANKEIMISNNHQESEED